MRVRYASVVVVFLALLAACGDEPVAPTTEDGASPPTPTSTTTASASDGSSPEPSARPARRGTKLIAADSDFGPVLFDDTRQAIYVFDVETTRRPRCYGSCADAWPPVLTDGAPLAGARVEPALLGTTRRTDGSTQVTYDGHPLYFYAHEGKDEVKCHDVFLNGGNWYAVQPDGSRAP